MTRNSSHARATTRRASLLAGAAALATVAAVAAPLLVPAAGVAAPAKAPKVSTETTSLGKILVGPNGRTLYLFEKDKNDKSACSGMCATFWPPLIASGKPVAGPGTKASLLGTTKRADGRLQVTYNRHPLYGFAKDTKKGQTNGQAVTAFGAEWFVTSPAGAKVAKAKAPAPTAAPTPAPTTGGY
jgi:predicted lipoprotein with Yx(FWY)xxD motif